MQEVLDKLKELEKLVELLVQEKKQLKEENKYLRELINNLIKK